MGLAERRAIKEFETTIYPGLKKQIDEAAGFEVALEVKWDTLAKDEEYVKSWAEAWPKLFFEPIIDAFKRICIDDMGKEALKEGLKKVVVQNTKESYSSYWAAFEAGVLTLDHQFTNVDYVSERTDTLVGVLEKGL
ncbi:MAG: hypothetical protein ACTHU0_35795 [Kofleriaceae bacterium]